MNKLLFLSVGLFLVLTSCNTTPSEIENIVIEEKNGIETSKVDTIGLEKFWQENITPILDKDTEKLTGIINFPIEGNWSSGMGFEKTEDKITSSEFFNNYDNLFDQTCMGKLNELEFNDVQVYIGDGYTQLIVSNGWEIPYLNKNGTEGYKEGGVILRFKRFQNRWKLFSIDSMK